MQFFLGVLVTVAFFLCLYTAYKAGTRARKPSQREVDEETIQKAQRIRQGFQQLMSYDVSKAYGKKVK